MKLQRFAALGRSWPFCGRHLPFTDHPLAVFRSKDGKWDDLAWMHPRGDWIYTSTLPAQN